MAELAHDASGPASPKSVDVAPQQASRPDSPDRGKLRVFISYSRDDLDFADQLAAALDFSGFGCFIDREGISGGEAWKRRLGNLISEADTVVFVLSPSSARSETCNWEVEEAAQLNKRILPANWRPLEGVSPPPRLRDLNYIFFYKEPKVPGSGFGTGLASLITALNTDFDWLREHTRYLQRAIEWDTGGRPANRLLSGNDILDAKAWVARRPKGAPEPTALQLDFIRASEDEAEARLSEQRKQLEAMAAAQAERETALHEAEEALKQAADAQRKRARIRNIAFVVVSVFAVIAGLLALYSVQQRKLAEEQRAVAEEQREQADDLLVGASRIIAKLQDHMDINTSKEVFAVFRTGADRGNSGAMGNLGLAYLHGRGVTQDYAKAREWFEKAADKGDAIAMAYLGQLYAEGLGVAQDYARARELYEKAADTGEALGMFSLGKLYSDAQDYAKAHDWFEKAADKGNVRAMANLGVLYNNGDGVTQDYVRARKWLEEAADKDDVVGMTYLGLIYENGEGVAQDYAKAHDWYEKAAGKGHAAAMTHLGVLYVNGHGVTQNYATARKWYEKAADKGNAHAMANLGLLYENGAGVTQDYAKAREWYEKAADKGHAGAMANLGVLYNNGHGVTQDYGKAHEWWEKAATKGEALGMLRLGQLYRLAQDYAKAREWFEKAADKGDANAMTGLGVLYATGEGVARDYVKAHEWYEKAADKGNAYAMAEIGLLYINGAGVTQDYAKAREWYEKAADKGEALGMFRLGRLYHLTQDYAKAREWYEKAADKGDTRGIAYLEELQISEAAGAGRYAEALQLQEAYAVKVEEVETKREGKPGGDTAQALNQVAWYALFARKYTRALAVADRAHALNPDDLAIDTNRAHALMFLKRGKDSKALYLAHKGKPMEQDGKLWERVIAEDFAEFRKAGLTHPMMADIEKELGVSPDGNSDIGKR